ncbi:AIM24 family protein [Nocardioides sp. ChNu-153]|uniref:AIM24 family protein n=1 Tax=unclassified Nocardioides TaxID=2615069 RepID=UPI002406FA39|nr:MULTISPECIES: AIM24 family protein [unclassified Nocardioides]MDF9716683.1 AIM24 family protein [Nocardioides sp. ChNu-99]MDN7121167.1 AIM24 family protein [Nocardioides sp. ChNu-153]
MRSELFAQDNLPKQSNERFLLQNAQTLRVGLGPDVLAAKGSMIAYQGNISFDHEGSGSIGKLAKKVLTSENLALMRVSGQGVVYFAEQAGYVNLMHLENEGISINARNLLAFDATLQWDINRTKGAGMMGAGLFNTTIGGTGTVAINAVGLVTVLDCSQGPVYVDSDAAVCWSANLEPGVKNSMNARSMLRGGTGEALQYVFQGPGFVVVQAFEWSPVPTS